MRLKYRQIKTGLTYFFGMVILGLLLLGVLFVVQFNTLKRAQVNMMSSDLKAYSVHLDNEMAYVTSNLLLLERVISNRDVLEVDGSGLAFTSEEDQTILEADLLDWIKNERIYDQIRVIDFNGLEMIRVNNNNGDPILVDEDDLQNKADRYYFQNSISLDNDTIYFSQIDLNVENGMIEYVDGQPKEMLRIASTFYDQNDQLLGVIVVNYLAESLFHDLDTKVANDIAFSVVNEEGYYLHSIDKEIEYGFMFDERSDENFNAYYNFDIFNLSGQTIKHFDKDGLVFASVVVDQAKIEEAISDFTQRDLDIYSDNGPIVIYGAVDLSETPAFQSLLNNNLIVFGILVFVALIISRLIDEISYNRKERLNLLEYTSNYDLLTELPNRLKMTQMIEYLTSRQESFFILFLDLDRFKYVNDQYGHLAGDHVLRQVSQRLQKCVRQTDIVGRIGGDEFLILLRDLKDKAVVLRIKEMIEEAINKDFILEQGVAQIGISVGYSFQSGEKSVEQIIALADDRMYQEKAMKKVEYN